MESPRDQCVKEGCHGCRNCKSERSYEREKNSTPSSEIQSLKKRVAELEELQALKNRIAVLEKELKV